MIVKTQGIVFHQIKYSETSLIVKIYTRELGLQSYLIKGARSKKSKFSPSLFQHLSLLEMEASHKKKGNLQHVREIRSAHQFNGIPFDVVKSSITVFVNELLMKSIQEEEANPVLFDFIFRSIQWLDLADVDFVNFHLLFAIQLSRFIGFYPRGVYSPYTSFFDLEEGCFENKCPIHPNYLKDNQAALFSELTEYTIDNMAKLKLSNDDRNALLDLIIQYYQLHLPNFGDLKSLDVLRVVMS